MDIISKVFTFIWLFIFSNSILAAVPTAPESVWKMFLAGNTQSIPSTHWSQDSRSHKELGYDDSYFLKSAPSNFKSAFPYESQGMYSTQRGYPSFLETTNYGHQCVAFAKAATGVFNHTSEWKAGGKVIQGRAAVTDWSDNHRGKMIAFFQGASTYPSGAGGKVGHVGIFLKYQIENQYITGIWIADTNWRGSTGANTEGKLRKHFIPIREMYTENTFEGRYNALNYRFVNIDILDKTRN